MKKATYLMVLPLFALLVGCGQNVPPANQTSQANNTTSTPLTTNTATAPNPKPQPKTTKTVSSGFTMPNVNSGSTTSVGTNSSSTSSSNGSGSSTVGRVGSGGLVTSGGSAGAIPISQNDPISNMTDYLAGFDFKGYFAAHSSEQTTFNTWESDVTPIVSKWESDAKAYESAFQSFVQKKSSYSQFETAYNKDTGDMIQQEEAIASTALPNNATPVENAAKMAWVQNFYDGNVVLREMNFFNASGKKDSKKYQQFTKDYKSYQTVLKNFQQEFGS